MNMRVSRETRIRTAVQGERSLMKIFHYNIVIS